MSLYSRSRFTYEELFFHDEKYLMTTRPLKILENNLKSFDCNPYHFGYIGTWELKYGTCLYLTSLDGYSEKKKVGLEYLFPNKKEVFANWFSGELRVPQDGMKLRYTMDRNPLDIVFNVVNGIVKNQKITDYTNGNTQITIFKDSYNDGIEEKIDTLSLSELIDMFNKNLEPFPEIIENINLDLKEPNRTKIDISNWDSDNKEFFFINILKGLINLDKLEAYSYLTNMTCAPIGSFKSVINAINGEKFVYVDSLWLIDFLREKTYMKTYITHKDFTHKDFYLLQEKHLGSDYSDNYNYHSSDDYDSSNWLRDAAGTDDPETMNDVYWNLD